MQIADTLSPTERLRTLSMQFLMAAGVLLLCAMMIAGYLIANLVSDNAVKNKAASTALFMHSVVAPMAQKLAKSPAFSRDQIDQLNHVLAGEMFRSRFPYFEIWTPDGVIAYSNSNQIIGQRFSSPDGLIRALAGEVAAAYADPSAREHVVRGIAARYLEIYSPIREDGSSRIIAVAEIHEHAEPFQRDLLILQLQSWAVVAAVTVTITLGLFGIVHRGSRTIEAQSAALKLRISEAERISHQNLLLKERSERASARVVELNEGFIRSIGADLHDGPAQLISFAVLKIDEIRQSKSAATREKTLMVMHSALDEALREIRSIAKGLLLPEIADLPLAGVIDRAVHAHEARTHTQVSLVVTALPETVSQAVRICVFRFLQEGLNNAYRHGGAIGQQVSSWVSECSLHVSVSDAGVYSPQLVKASVELDKFPSQDRLGLHGLRERVESLGGTLTVRRQADGGILIQMSLAISGGHIVA